MIKNEHDPEDVARVKEEIAALLNRFGPRMAGTKAALGVAQEIKRGLGEFSDRVFLDSFFMHPDSFWAIPSLTAAAFTLSSVLYFLNSGIIVTLIPIFLGLLFTFFHFILLGGMFDRLFPQKNGLNVVGVMEPKKVLRRQIVICAHHDSARRCRFLERWQILYPFRMIPAMLFYSLTALGLMMSALPFAGLHAVLQTVLPWIILIGSIFVLPFTFFYRRAGSPGAGDNLLGVMLLIEAARLVRDQLGGLASTRLILVSHDGEEVGMRGARAFINTHRELLHATPTIIVNLDSLHNLDDLILLASDRNGTVPLSGRLNESLQSLWHKAGIQVAIRSLPLGGGGTDAAVYAAAGFPAASLIGISTDFIRSGLVYHTFNDDVDHLDDRVIRAALDMIRQFVIAVDRDDCFKELFIHSS